MIKVITPGQLIEKKNQKGEGSYKGGACGVSSFLFCRNGSLQNVRAAYTHT